MKKIIALVLAIVLTLSFSACNKDKTDELQLGDKPGNDQTQTEDYKDGLFFVDEEGVTQKVEKDDDGKYYVTDEKGNVSYIEDVGIIEQIKENEEQAQEKNESEEQIGDTTFSSKEAEERLKDYKTVITSNKFTLKGVIKSSDDELGEFPLTYMKNGDDFYMEAAVTIEEGKTMDSNILYLDGTMYCMIPSLRMYFTSEDEMDDLATGTLNGDQMKDLKYVSTNTVKINNTDYTVDVYEIEKKSANNKKTEKETYKYYFDSNNKLVRMEEIMPGDEYVIIELSSYGNSVETSKFKKPVGYVDITSMMS